jgi:predicted nucleic acid-binding protein
VLVDDLEVVELVEATGVLRVVPSDAEDDLAVAAAVAGGATMIVSSDSDLLRLGNHQGIDIVSAVMALANMAGTGMA